MKTMTRLALFAALLGLAACKGKTEAAPDSAPAATKKDEPPAKPDDNPDDKPDEVEAKTLTVYSGRSEKLIAPAIEAYEKASGVDVQVKYADSAQLAATLLEEGARSPADVFIAQDASTASFLEGKGVFAKLPAKLTEGLPGNFKSADGFWAGISGRARVLAYNTSKVKAEELPKSADELTGEAWKGRVGWAPPNASFQSFVAAMIQLRGEEKASAWLTAMLANAPKDYPKNTPAVIAVSRGEVDVALVNHYYLYRLKDEHGADFPVANHYFRSGAADSMVNVSAAGVLKTSKKAEAGAAFIEYLLSPEGQAHFVKANHEFPVAPGAKSPDGLPPIEGLNAPTLKLNELGNLESAVKLLRTTGVLR